jgi:hypothetical protein
LFCNPIADQFRATCGPSLAFLFPGLVHAKLASPPKGSARFGAGGGPHGVEQIGNVHGGALGFAPAGPMPGGPLMAPVPHQPAYMRGGSPLG